MNHRRYLFIFITGICVTLNIAGIFLYKKHAQVTQSSNWVAHTYAVIGHTQAFYGNIEQMIAVQRGYLLTGNEKYFTRYDAAWKEVTGHLQALKTLTVDNVRQQQRVHEFESIVTTLREVLESRIAEAKAMGRTHARLQVDVDKVKDLADATRKLIDATLAEEQLLLAERLKEEEEREANYANALMIASLVSVIVIVIGNMLLLKTFTRQQQTEGDLQITKDRLNLALLGTNDGVFDWKIGSDYIFLSDRFRQMLGYTEEELPGTIVAFDSITHPEDRKHNKQYNDSYLNGEISQYRNLFRLQHKNGSWRWHLSRAVAVYDAQGEPIRLVGSHTDITDQKIMEEQLKASNKELEEFTYIASHDLRSPLVNLKGFAGEIEFLLKRLTPFVRRALPLTPDENPQEIADIVETELPQAVGFIKSSVTRMDKLTQLILELSRLGRRELRMDRVDTAEVVKHALEVVQHQLDEKNIQVTVCDLPEVTADHVSIEQVFANIIDNAIKYLDPKRSGSIEITSYDSPSETIFQITDNGRGIAKADIHKVFEIFKRAGNNADIPGEGMGMPYVQATIRRHGGTIWCRSEPGVGTTFYFTIPHHINKEKPHA